MGKSKLQIGSGLPRTLLVAGLLSAALVIASCAPHTASDTDFPATASLPLTENKAVEAD